MVDNKGHVFFFFFFLYTHKIYVVNICKNCLTEAIQTSVHNICFLSTIFLNIYYEPSHFEVMIFSF